MNFEHFERGYLLPKGCKDLIDVLNLQAKPQAKIFSKPGAAPPKQVSSIKGELWVSDSTTVKQLAALLGQKPFEIVADAMALGIFANVNQPLGFGVICKISAKYGYTAKRRT